MQRKARDPDRRLSLPAFVGHAVHPVAGMTVELQDLDAHAVHRAEIQGLVAPPVGRSGRETQFDALCILALAREQREVAAIGDKDCIGRLAGPEKEAAFDSPEQRQQESGQQQQQPEEREGCPLIPPRGPTPPRRCSPPAGPTAR